MQNQLDSVETEEEKLRNIKEWKRYEFLEIDYKKKAVDKENLVHEKGKEALALEKVKLLETMYALEGWEGR